MSTIRPQVQQYPQPQYQGSGNPGRLAAQQAFFALAGQARPPTTAQAPQTTAAAAPGVLAQVATPTSQPADAPQKILRPGSLVDIRV